MVTRVTVAPRAGNNAQFLRKCSVFIEDPNGNQMEFTEEYSISFQTHQSDIETPNNAIIRIYNLSPNTAHLIEKEFSIVRLQAGYQNGPYGLIFLGTIKQVRRGRVNATDTFLDIMAADGDEAYSYGVINKTFDPKTDQKTILKETQEAIKVDPGFQDIGSSPGVLSRPKVMFGMARVYLRQMAENKKSIWSIQNGKLNFYKRTSYIPLSEPIILTGQTGLIGLPVQTPGGINVRALINPDFRIGHLIKINDESIQKAFIGENTFLWLPGRTDKMKQEVLNALLPPLSNDGTYRIYVSEFSGSTRGNDWYADLVCIASDPSASPEESVGD